MRNKEDDAPEVKPAVLGDIQELVDFEPIIPPDVKDMVEPTDEDLRLLRDVIDAEGYFLKRVIKK